MCQHTLLYLSCILRKIRVLVISQFSSHSWGNDAFCVLWFILGMQSFEHVFFVVKHWRTWRWKPGEEEFCEFKKGKESPFSCFKTDLTLSPLSQPLVCWSNIPNLFVLLLSYVFACLPVNSGRVGIISVLCLYWDSLNFYNSSALWSNFFATGNFI